MSLQFNNQKNKIIFVMLTIFVVSFVWIFLGATDPFRIVSHESIAEMQEKIDTDCYYFDIEAVRPDYISSKIERWYYTNKSCVTRWDDPNDLPVAYEIAYFIEYEYVDYTFSIHADFERENISIEESDFFIKINAEEIAYVIADLGKAIQISINFMFDNICYTLEIGKKYYTSNIAEAEKQEILDSMKAEVESGLFERIYNTGCKKDGTKLVAE